MQVFAVGKCASSAGRIVTEGIGWKPSSDAGNAGEPVQKYTYIEKKNKKWLNLILKLLITINH